MSDVPNASRQVQDLSAFALPQGFRGRSGFVVQLWWIVQALLVHPTPQVMYGWRRFVLRLFGARVGSQVLLRSSVRITYPWKVAIGDRAWIGDNVELYSLGEIRIGHDSVISQGSYLCTASHDYRDTKFAIFTRSIVVDPEVWIATQCFIGPGVTIGRGAVVGARSLVLTEVLPYSVVVGHPSRVIGDRIRSKQASRNAPHS